MYPTIILRHRKENLKKCSLRGLEKRKDIIFYTYPKDSLPDMSNYVLLKMDAPELSEKDSEKGLFLIDSTWMYLSKILKIVPNNMERRSLPKKFMTAYPRKQTGCPDPKYGLASIEALYLSLLTMNKDTSNLLDDYYFKDQFLKINNLV
jgi:pre-rRNA-processing protein TSR3